MKYSRLFRLLVCVGLLSGCDQKEPPAPVTHTADEFPKAGTSVESSPEGSTPGAHTADELPKAGAPVESSPEGTAPGANITDELLKQLKWPLEERNTYGTPRKDWMNVAPGDLAEEIRKAPTMGRLDDYHRTIEALVLDGTESSRTQAREILELLLADGSDEKIEDILTPEGPASDDAAMRQWHEDKSQNKPVPMRSSVIRHKIRYQAYYHAMLYLLTGEQEHAERAKHILLRMAEVVPQWPVYYEESGESRPQDADDPAWFEKTLSGGLWGAWHPLDLGMSQPLLRAYDILHPTLSSEERELIESDFFLHHKKLMERFSAQLPYGNFPHYHNMMAYHLVPLIRFGWVLDRPDFIHDVLTHWRKCLDYAYSPDGFFKEVSPAYHRQLTVRLERTIPVMLKGYSDPEGYTHPETGERLDNLDLMASTAPRFAQIQAGLDVLSMPNGNYVSLNDDHANTLKPPLNVREGVKLDAPGLLGISGVAKLGADGMTAFLKFGGMRGHDHYDALNLVWFAGGKEVFSDTGYLPIPGSGATREWISDTASHMTVAVDEQKHLQNRGSLVIPERHKYTSYNSYPPPVPRFYADRYPAEASLPGAAEFFNQGRLLLWDATRPEVQAMEAEQENAYPGLATLFRRTIVMVSFGKGEGYLVDIFRVRGGQTHDYFLRGGLDEPYEMRFDASLSPDQRTLYSHINVHSTAEVDEKMKAEVLYKNGLKTTSRLAGVFGTDSATQHLFVGEAPAIRRMGTAPFSVLRRSGEAPLDSCFVWVHEVSAGASRIKEVDATQDGGNVMLKVTRTDDTEDIILSGSSDDSRFAFDGISFEGRLAFLSDSRSAVFSGGPLIKTTQTLAEAAPFLSGKLLSSTSKDNGDEEDSVLVELETGPENTGHPVNVRLAHFDMGDVIRFSIPVSDARWENGKLRVLLEHGPGFEVDDEDTVMTRYPGWRVFSGTSVRLDLHPEKN